MSTVGRFRTRRKPTLSGHLKISTLISFMLDLIGSPTRARTWNLQIKNRGTVAYCNACQLVEPVRTSPNTLGPGTFLTHKGWKRLTLAHHSGVKWCSGETWRHRDSEKRGRSAPSEHQSVFRNRTTVISIGSQRINACPSPG